MDYRIFNVHTDVNTCDYTMGVYGDHKRVCVATELCYPTYTACRVF